MLKHWLNISGTQKLFSSCPPLFFFMFFVFLFLVLRKQMVNRSPPKTLCVGSELDKLLAYYRLCCLLLSLKRRRPFFCSFFFFFRFIDIEIVVDESSLTVCVYSTHDWCGSDVTTSSSCYVLICGDIFSRVCLSFLAPFQFNIYLECLSLLAYVWQVRDGFCLFGFKRLFDHRRIPGIGRCSPSLYGRIGRFLVHSRICFPVRFSFFFFFF